MHLFPFLIYCEHPSMSLVFYNILCNVCIEFHFTNIPPFLLTSII